MISTNALTMTISIDTIVIRMQLVVTIQETLRALAIKDMQEMELIVKVSLFDSVGHVIF